MRRQFLLFSTESYALRIYTITRSHWRFEQGQFGNAVTLKLIANINN